MPFTPYHFGPSGFIGLLFRKWLDIPVFVLANVIVDLEVLVIWNLDLGFPIHRYCHTLLIGAAVGALWGLAAYPLRSLFKWPMRILHIPYKTSLPKMLISGVLGVWLHVLIDGFYHWDIKPFWPEKTRLLYRFARQHHIDKNKIENICAVLLLAAIIPYIFAVLAFLKNKKLEAKVTNETDR